MFAKPTPLFLFLFLVCFCKGKAQIFLTDTNRVYSRPVAGYLEARDKNLLLYNGIEYARSYPNTTGYPFFLTDVFQRSPVLYDGVWYDDVPMAYDEVSDRVIIKNRDSFLVELVPEKVGSFVFKNHVFVSLSIAAIKSETMPPGLYEVYDYNSITVFIHHQKVVQRSGNPADPDHFTPFDTYYIRRDKDYFPIKNNNALLGAFADRSNEIKSFLHQNKLSYKKQPEEAIVKAAAWYAGLKK